MMSILKKFSLITLLGLIIINAQAEVAVIVSHDNKNTYTGVDMELVTRIFLGKTANFPDGSVAKPVYLKRGSGTREEFNKSFLGKSENQLGAYWAKLRFSGKAKLPKEVSSAKEMKVLIANNPDLIGYIDSLDVDSTVKVVHQY